jgi:peptidoglycan hydrolase-like protein with peptidoglycan-binding domain
MPLQSVILSGNARLEQAAIGPPSIKRRPPDDDADAVKRIQRALVKLGQRMPISFPNGPDQEPDGLFGDETFRAVQAYQQRVFPNEASQWDGRVGPNTLAKMDADLPKPPPPPPPTPTPPASKRLKTKQEAVLAIRAYLTREMKRDVAKLLVDHPANLILLGETHYTFDSLKSALLTDMVRIVKRRQPVVTHFHASERMNNDPIIRKQISDFLHASPARQRQLAPKLAIKVSPFVNVLSEAANFPNQRYGILPIDNNTVHGEDSRHDALFKSFGNSATQCPDVPSGSINSTTSRGNILLGAHHAARSHVLKDSQATMCKQLAKPTGLWNVHAVYRTVPVDPSQFVPDSFDVVLRAKDADQTPINCLEIAESLAGGKPFYADLTKSDSPFSQLRSAESGAADKAFNSLYDAMVHLSK